MITFTSAEFFAQAGLPDFSSLQHTKTGRKYTYDNKIYVSKGNRIYKKAIEYLKRPLHIPNGSKMFQKAIKYTNIFHSTAL
jgi:hypothetical protein